MNSSDELLLKGLSQSEAESRLLQYGPNTLPVAKKPGLLQIFLHQYKSPFIYVLLVAAIVSFALGQIINCVFIFLVLLLNASIGTFQEYAAQKAATGLEKLVPQRATVYRDGKPVVIDAAEIVPGDIVALVSGDKVPADLRLLELQDLQIDESMLTGESIAAEKKPANDEHRRNSRRGPSGHGFCWHHGAKRQSERRGQDNWSVDGVWKNSH